MPSIKNLSVVDVVTIAVVWAGPTAVIFTLKPVDDLVVIVAIASAYYSAKWVILKGEKLLSPSDIIGIFLCWSGATAVSYFAKDGILATVCVAAAYYLSKWIIQKRVDGPTH